MDITLDSTNTLIGLTMGLVGLVTLIFGASLRFLIPILAKTFLTKKDFEGYKSAVKTRQDDFDSRLSVAVKSYSEDHDILVRLEENVKWIKANLQELQHKKSK